ncbi:MAG: hypothetical protein HZA24_02915 [Nitrospirae bacterium]|nr:hypothetical protein [Nitrospirota bacterium]
MTFLNVAIMVGILLAAMVASMLYYGSRGKKQIRHLFDGLASAMGGGVAQQNRMHYPHWTTQVAGRPAELFFYLSEGHRKTADIVYLVLATPIRLPSASLVVEEGFFTTAPDKGSFNAVAGDYLAGLMPGRYVYATDEAATVALFARGGLAERLEPLGRYPNIVLGPDAITVGKPYGGALDLTPERIGQDLAALAALAAHLETVAAPPADAPPVLARG